jgi:uncharacterized protein with HEPN domain
MPRPSTSERDLGFIDDILTRAETLREIMTGVNLEEFLNIQVTRLAAERLLGIIGEAASKVSSETRDSMPGVPWREMSGTRNRLAHDYANINQTLIYQIATVSVPEMVAILRNELNSGK